MNIDEISSELKKLSTAKRIKFIRQKILNQNQQTFCEDGIVRSGTLKSIESERMKIGPKIAERLVHKLSLEGIKCQTDLFLEPYSPCFLEIDFSKRQLAGESMGYLEEIRKKIAQLTPIIINTDEFEPLIPKGTTLLTHEAEAKDLMQLKSKLCYIKGDKSFLYYLTYFNEKELKATFNNKEVMLSTSMLEFCTIYVVEIIYFGK